MKQIRFIHKIRLKFFLEVDVTPVRSESILAEGYTHNVIIVAHPRDSFFDHEYDEKKSRYEFKRITYPWKCQQQGFQKSRGGNAHLTQATWKSSVGVLVRSWISFHNQVAKSLEIQQKEFKT